MSMTSAFRNALRRICKNLYIKFRQVFQLPSSVLMICVVTSLLCVCARGGLVIKAWLKEVTKRDGILATCYKTAATVNESLVVLPFPVTSFCENVLMNCTKRIRMKILRLMETWCSKHGGGGRNTINGKICNTLICISDGQWTKNIPDPTAIFSCVLVGLKNIIFHLLMQTTCVGFRVRTEVAMNNSLLRCKAVYFG
jgi:hypothetical protein